ncbi:mitochondrial ribosome-associated GTPase 2 isoform X1 [Stomoxys calcitrans]|uniref:mitochondrial ribosome-associated GTPase 2 isoform X1 n=2 Tax=Stomoxys calcitrans TaxID=35570 RepID=UPI0027E36ED6|nr:mitochondrial ribosome-associated GTPase 2 isoform X1 [Stomoxys calcitrans]
MSLRRVCSSIILRRQYCANKPKEWRTNNDITMTALRPKKAKSEHVYQHQHFSDVKMIRTVGGKGGDGCVSFLQLWCNERAGPDGGDGGNGGHIMFEASSNISNLYHISNNIRGDEGQSGTSQNCHGKNAKHTVVKVPIGTIIRNQNGVIIGDLSREGMMFIAARGGAGGKGNTFFTTDKENAPKVCEHGPPGEDCSYILEMRCIADIGIIGFPNAGKSTLLNAISRARPKVAPYAFTTLRPNIGMIQYADSFQLAVADLPGIIPDAHRNKGLGLQFLKHAEHCSALMFLLDVSSPEPWLQYDTLLYEMNKFSEKLANYPRIIVANKIDMPESKENLMELRERVGMAVIGISAKVGTNLKELLKEMRKVHLKQKQEEC